MHGPDLTERVHEQFDWLVKEHGFTIAEMRSGLFKLRGDAVTLWISCSLDLPQLNYIEELPDGEGDRYDIWNFLAMRRRQVVESCFSKSSETMTIYEVNCQMLKVLACALKGAGMDIVSGDKSWRKEYPGSPVRLNKNERACY